MNDHAQRKHSIFSASGASRWMTCTASALFTKDIPSKDSPYAKEGTRAHEFCEHCLNNKVEPLSLIGTLFKDETVDSELANAASVYFDLINSLEGDVTLETRFDLSWIVKNKADLFGTTDAVALEPFSKVTIVDFKYGKGVPVHAENNKQLMYYALGALGQNNELSIDKVELIVVQPRIEGNEISRWETTSDVVYAFAEEVRTAVNSALKGGEFVPSDKACRFCPANSSCPSLKNMTEKKLDMLLSTPVEGKVVPSVQVLTNEQLRDILDHKNLIEKFLSEVESHVFNKLEKGEKVEGYKLVKKRAIRKWKNEEEAVAEFALEVGSSAFETKIKSVAQMEKVASKELVAKFSETPDTGNTLAPTSDKRPEVIIKPVLDLLN